MTLAIIGGASANVISERFPMKHSYPTHSNATSVARPTAAGRDVDDAGNEESYSGRENMMYDIIFLVPMSSRKYFIITPDFKYIQR